MVEQLRHFSWIFAFALCCALLVKAASADDGLHSAASDGDVDKIEKLIRAGADVNATNDIHETPLLIAAGRGHAPAAEALIRAGANVNAQTDTGYSPLHAAADYGHSAVVVALIRGKADVNILNELNLTPLHLAASWGFIDSVNALIKAGANVNAKTIAGETPLYFVLANAENHANIKKYWKNLRGEVPLKDYEAVADVLKNPSALDKTESGGLATSKTRQKGRIDGGCTVWDYGKWQLCRQSDELYGTNYYAQSARTNPVRSLPYKNVQAQIVMSCEEGDVKDEVVIFLYNARKALGSENKIVHYKFDGEEPVREWWTVYEGTISNRNNKRGEWPALIAKYETLLLEVELKGGHAARFRFNLAGSGRAIAELSKECS